MALTQLQFFSPALDKACSMNLILPDLCGQKGPYPVLYLLHGCSDDHSAWTRYTSIERYCQKLALIVVMPDAHRSYYTDSDTGYAYESHIIKDVIPFVDNHFSTIAKRSHRFIEGLSMGGFGAVKLGFRYPHLFSSVVGHSGSYDPMQIKFDQARKDEQIRLFGQKQKPEDDLFALAENANKEELPSLFLNCGKNDFLIKTNRKYHQHLENLQIPHEYKEYPGIHDWDYWDKRLPESLAFHMDKLEH